MCLRSAAPIPGQKRPLHCHRASCAVLLALHSLRCRSGRMGRRNKQCNRTVIVKYFFLVNHKEDTENGVYLTSNQHVCIYLYKSNCAFLIDLKQIGSCFLFPTYCKAIQKACSYFQPHLSPEALQNLISVFCGACQ